MLNCAFQKNPASGASTGLSSLFFGSPCPFSLHAVHRVGWVVLVSLKGWQAPEIGTEETDTISQGRKQLSYQSLQAWHSHRVLGGKSQRWEVPLLFPPTVTLHTCSVIRGESKEELWTGDKCLIKISQDSKATTKQPSSKILPFLFTQSMSLLFSVLKHQNEIYRVSVVTRIAKIKLEGFRSFRAQ